MRNLLIHSIGTLLISCVVWLSPARAEILQFHANLSGTMEVPPTVSNGTGEADITYDTGAKKLTWKVTYSNLTGPATGAHFHGPAPAGKNAPVEVPVSGSLASPLSGSATLSETQAQDLMNGNMYFNIHTDANKNGEIRGQVEKGGASKAG